MKPKNRDGVINNLQQENKSLLIDVDSLKRVNVDLDNRNLEITKKLEKLQYDLIDNNRKINKLQNDKDKIPVFVNNLSANGVTRELTNYLNNRTK